MTMTKMVWRVEIAGSQLSGGCQWWLQRRIRRELTAREGVNLPLVVERDTLEERDKETCEIGQGHHDICPLDQKVHSVDAISIQVC